MTKPKPRIPLAGTVEISLDDLLTVLDALGSCDHPRTSEREDQAWSRLNDVVVNSTSKRALKEASRNG
jgi:hypothetical protein